ncbi:MAG: hypothetical protein HKM24_02505 [Gammaproteobacteria bacterium]|nr:hypothetical protein [Gammaproteobacteria bacterium]
MLNHLLTTHSRWLAILLAALATTACGPSNGNDDDNPVSTDTTAPVVSNVSPATGFNTPASSILVTGNATDDTGIDSVTVNGTTASTANGFSNWQASVALSVGANVITIAASDTVGNSNSNAASIVVTRTDVVTDNDAPTAAISSPVNGSSTTDNSIVVTGTASDATGVASIVVNGVTAGSADGFANWQATVPLNIGANTIIVATNDTLGNSDSSAASITVTRNNVPTDTDAPTAVITDPTDNVQTELDMVTVVGTAADATAIASIMVNGIAATTSDGYANWQADLTLVIGKTTVTVRSEDTLGNIDTNATSISITREAVELPTANITAPNDGATINATEVVVQGTATDNVGVASVTVNGVTATTADDFANWQATVPLVVGANTIVAAATDTAGNVDSTADSITVTRDDNPPEFGLDTRPSNTTCIAPDLPIPTLSTQVNRVFDDLPSFTLPIWLGHEPGNTDKWYVIEKAGRVKVFNNNATVNSSSDFIDIRGQVDTSGNEEGLLGMAFHPNYANNREVFLSYINSNTTRISRFTSTDGGATLNVSTEEIVFSLSQPYSNHNGGDIHFGPDGYLYIGLGDGGSGGDPLNSGQDTSTLLGNMLRIDVDTGSPYSIPSTNPFAAGTGCNDLGCREIYAWGLRNPWRWSFDMATGDLWLGDVGQNAYEEIDIIENGGNYGWRIREGAHCYNASSCDTTGLIDPVAEYSHSLGSAVTGGYVYRGSDIPLLAGKYVFGDYVSGRLWTLLDDGNGGYTRTELNDLSFNISSFGQDTDGEIYLVNYGSGTIHKLNDNSSTGGGGAANKLSETGCADAADPKQPSAGLIPYDLNAPFWSDNAIKTRWLAIPDGTTITINSADDLDFPAGSVIRKDFEIDNKLVETRLLMHHPDGTWAGYSYEWNDTETEADLLSGSKTKDVGSQDWYYPSSAQCDGCHTQAAGYSLGPEVAQLNRDLTYPTTGNTANQLATLEHISMFSSALADIPDNLPRFVDLFNIAEPLVDRARAYLHTNCSSCHRPTGPTQSNMDLRATTALNLTNACDVVPSLGNLGITDPRIIATGNSATNADRSVLINRINRRDANGMPPFGSLISDDFGTGLMTTWVNSLSNCN